MDTKSTETTQSLPLSAPPPYSPPNDGLYATANPAYRPDETGLVTIATSGAGHAQQPTNGMHAEGMIHHIQPPPAYTPTPVNVHLNTFHAQPHVQV